MNNSSRKVKNPLLSGAGPGFSFDSYAENTLLVPVRPSSAVLRDDAELDNFIGQEPANTQSQSPSKLQENFPSDAFSQLKENKDIVNQPAKSGYFTTILSSLPNLSLSSIKSDALGSQINQTIDNTSSGVVHESNPYISSQGSHGSQSEIPGFLAINSHNPRSTNLSGFGVFGPADTASNPPQPALPPSLPQSGYAPVSYRLGNQRRLKYAPPPDLTTNNAKPSPAIQTFFSTQNVSAPSSILNPSKPEGTAQDNNTNVHQASSLSEQLPKFEQQSGNNSLRKTFLSNPITTNTTNSSVISTTQNQFSENSSVSSPSQFVSSLSRPIPTQILEPATPQNTPANISFPGFTPYGNRDILPTSNLDREVVAFRNLNQPKSSSEFSRDSISETTIASAHIPSLLSETKATFTPISAAKVTEKLEHLLAEQKEDSPCIATSETFSKLDEITPSVATELTKSFESQSETPLTTNEFIDESYKTKLNDVQKKIIQSGNDTWSDVFLGQESAAESVICPEVQTIDNNPVLTDNQTTESNIHLPQQYFQLPSTSMPSSAFYADKPADQKSSLNYVPSVQPPQSSFCNPPKPTEQSANVFFELTKSDGFSNFPQEKNINSSFGQSNALVIDPTNNPQQVQENLTFSSTTIDSTVHVPFWSADQTSQSQVLNATSNQPLYTAPNQSPTPTFYNPTQFINELPKQVTFSHTYNQQSPQQQSYHNPSLYENISGLQQSYSTHEDNTAYSSPAVSMVTTIPEPTGSATLSPIQMSVNAPINRTTPDTIPPSFQNWAAGSSDKHMPYRLVYHHWFYRKELENKILWLPFSMQDSLKLEEIHNSTDITPETTVATEGGRYDVDILRRQRAPVYWTGVSTEVRRCSWFFKGSTESRYIPYTESTAAKLEEEYKQACLTNNWNRRIDLNNGEYIVFHSATVQVHYVQPTSPDSAGAWGNSTGSEDSAYLQGTTSRPRVVKRGVDEFNIDEGEPEKVDHLLFLVHGIGSVCDLKFRTVEEVVDEFRSISLQLVQSHYRTASEQGIVNRIEVLPISWHTTLHSEDTGIDKKLQSITLESIPKLRHFTNDTLLDILFYTSPVYCQTIMRTVGSEINRLHFLFKERNPTFDGDIYLGGHSLGSLILFDLLCHQNPIKKEEEKDEKDDEHSSDDKEDEKDSIGPIKPMPAAVLKRRLSRKISYVVTGAAGTGQPYIHYPQLNFHPRAFFALGSPIGMFVTVRGIDALGEDFTLPTCPAFFNIFHPFDPVAYRVESLINPEAHKFRPMLIPHHKGRKRMHLELKETMARVGADLKQKLIDSVKHTWNSFYQLALFHKPDNQALEREIDKVVEEQLQKQPSVSDQHNNDDGGANLKIGELNGGRRIDYVLQEAPFEYINEYIFALTSHICYWESEDTMLLILKEIYGFRGIQTDTQLPQQTMSIEKMSPSPSFNLAAALSNNESNVGTSVMGIDPTTPMSSKSVGPPPKTGFVPKS